MYYPSNLDDLNVKLKPIFKKIRKLPNSQFEKPELILNIGETIQNTFKNPINNLKNYINSIETLPNYISLNKNFNCHTDKSTSKYLFLKKTMDNYNGNLIKLQEIKTDLINIKLSTIFKKYFLIKIRKTKNNVEHIILLRNYLRIKQNNKCALCNTNLNEDCTFEHIIPISKDGFASLQNGAAVHKWCNEYLGVLKKKEKIKLLNI